MVPIDRDPSTSKLRWFGLLWFPAFVGLLGFLVLRHAESLRGAIVVWSIGAALVGAGLFSTRVLRWIWIGLLTLTFPIGWTISNLLMLLIYTLLVTPIGILLRLARRDPMRRRLDPEAISYWQPAEREPEPRSYFRQF